MSKLAGGLPQGIANGIADLDAQLVSEPERSHVIIAVVSVAKITEDVDSGVREPTLRIRRVERILPQDAFSAERLMRRAIDKRMGADHLPIEVEDELSHVFRDASIDDQGVMLYPEAGPAAEIEVEQ